MSEKFNISVSEQCYTQKPMGNQISSLRFHPTSMDQETLIERIRKGHSFCYNFKHNQDYIAMSDKTSSNFISTQTLFFDFDVMKISMNDFITNLQLKPNIGYTSFNNGIGDYRYRLIYILNEPIFDKEAFTELYMAIKTVNMFQEEKREQGIVIQGGLDMTSSRISQLYYGSKQNADIYYQNSIFYSIDEFTSHKSNIAYSIVNSNYQSKEITIDKEFLNDIYSLSPSEIIDKYHSLFYSNYIKSLKTDLILSDNHKYYTYPEDYAEVLHKRKGKDIVKWPIGSGRKNKLFTSACIMMKNNKILTIENLIYNLIIERSRFYCNDDKKITNQVIVYTAKNAFHNQINISTSKHPKTSVNKQYWKERNITPNQAKNIVRKEIRAQEIMKYYNWGKTRAENHRLLNEQGIKVGKSTLYRLVSTVSKFPTEINKEKQDTVLSEWESDDTNQQIIKLIIGNENISTTRIGEHIGLSPATIKRKIKLLQEKGIIKRIGNNRNGRWITIP